MAVTVLEKLLKRYDIAISYANGGSFDNWFMKKFRLSWITKWKPFENLYLRTYAFPFGKSRFYKEKKLDLRELRAFYNISNLRSGKNDVSSKEAIEMIDNSLAEIPQIKKKKFAKIFGGIWQKVSGIISIPLIAAAWTFAEQFYPILLLIGVIALMPTIMIIIDKAFLYFSEKLWYRITAKKLCIPELKKKIINDLVAVNNASF